MISFRSYADLNTTIKNSISLVPKDIDLIVGIPRSGLLVANLVALYLNKPLVDLEGLIKKRTFSGGLRLNNKLTNFSKINKVLVIDDSLNSGASLEKAKTKIKEAKLKQKILYSVVYLKPGQENKVDFYFEHCPLPRVFEWNLFHHDILNRSSVDIDGILCRDPTEEENDDGIKYLEFIRTVPPQIIPTVEISHLVTCRLEKYRKETEKWLRKNNIKYKNLIMMPFRTKEERVLAGNHAAFKADEFSKSNTDLFIESNPHQAKEIFNITQKDVYSFSESLMFTNKSNSEEKIQNKEINHEICFNNIDRNRDEILVTFFSHSSQLAGAERSLIELIKELKYKKIKSHVVLPNEGPLQKELEEINIPYDIIKLKWWASTNNAEDAETIDNNSDSYKNLTNYLPKLVLLNPDLIYSNTLASPWGAIAAQQLNKPHVWHIREFGNLDHNLKFCMVYPKVIQFIENYSNLIIVNSNSVSQHISKFLKKLKPEVVYNYIDIPDKLLEEKIESPYKYKNSLKIIVCGNISPGKNQIEAVKSINELLKKEVNVELLLLGTIADTNYLNQITDYIKTNKIENRVYIIDFVKNPYPYIKCSDIVLIPSIKEAFGRTAVEGMLLKKVVIASSEGGTKEIIENRNTGFIYPLGNTKDLCEIISKLTDRYLLNQISINGFNFINKINTKNNYGLKVAELIKNTIVSQNRFQVIPELIKNMMHELIKNSKQIQERNILLQSNIYKLESEKEHLQKDLTKIQSSKTYKIWQKFNKLKKTIIFPLKIFFNYFIYWYQLIPFFSASYIIKIFTFSKNLAITDFQTEINGISFIIPTWNKRDMVTDCVKNLILLLERESPEIQKEIIVLDNGSNDNTKESILKLKSKVLIRVIRFKKNLGFGKAVNIGAKKSKFNYIYLLNNDMFPKENFLNNIIKFAKLLIKNKKPFFGIASQIFFLDKTKRREESGKTYIQSTLGFINVAHFVENINLNHNSITTYPGGGSSLINKNLFLLLGGYDYKSFTPLYCEDLDLGFISWKLGFPSYYCNSSEVIHMHRSSSNSLNKDPSFFMYKNWLTFMYKNLDNPSLIIKHLLVYPLFMLRDLRYKEYFYEVSKNIKVIYKAKSKLYKFKQKYKDKDLIDFIKFELKFNEGQN